MDDERVIKVERVELTPAQRESLNAGDVYIPGRDEIKAAFFKDVDDRGRQLAAQRLVVWVVCGVLAGFVMGLWVGLWLGGGL